MKDFAHNGTWWIPGKKSRSSGGLFTFSQKSGGTLELTPPLAIGEMSPYASVGKTLKVIHGIIEKERVTLYDCWIGGVRGNTQRVIVSYAFIGEHLKESACRFNKVKVAFTFLPEFCNHSGVSKEFQMTSLNTLLGREQTEKNTASISVKAQAPLRLGTYKKEEYSVQYSWKQSEESLRSYTISEGCYFVIKLSKSQSVDTILVDKIQPIRHLVTLATNERNEIEEMYLERRSKRQPNTFKKVKVLMRSDVKAPRLNSFMFFNMLFRLSDLDEAKLSCWLEMNKKYRPTIDLVFGYKNAATSGLENSLLNMVTALEAYHQRHFKNYIKPTKAWDAHVESIITRFKEQGLLNSSERFKLKRSLKFLNSKGLDLRLSEVLAYSNQAEFIPNKQWWINEILDYRNSLTHFNPDHPKSYDTHDEDVVSEIFYLTRSIMHVLICCFLIELGFDKDEITKMFNNNGERIHTYHKLSQIYDASTGKP